MENFNFVKRYNWEKRQSLQLFHNKIGFVNIYKHKSIDLRNGKGQTGDESEC